jgi:putative serine protease PepD
MVMPRDHDEHLWAGPTRGRRERPERPDAAALPAGDALEEARRRAATLADADRPTAAASGSVSADGPGRRSRRPGAWLAAAIGAVAAILIIGLAVLLSGGNKDDQQAGPAAPLPAAKGEAGKTTAGRIYAAVSGSVVSVRAGNATGTGFVVQSDGTIVTNEHVVDNAKTVQVRFGQAGRDIRAEVLGIDTSSDIAVLKVDAQAAGNPKPLALADSEKVRVGDAAVAIGSPFGLDRTATAGIVSALGRDIKAPNGFTISDAIQTDAPINPGNSGGPLLDDRGRVIGVNSQIAAGSGGGNVGIGFAVSSNTLRKVVPDLKRGRDIRRAYLGISTGDAPGGGAEVGGVVDGGPAQSVGVRVGDIIKRVDGKSINQPADVAKAIADKRPGDAVAVEVQRGESPQTLHVTLDERPATAADPQSAPTTP